MEDWRRFKQLEVEKREEQSKEKDLLAKRLALTCRSQVSALAQGILNCTFLKWIKIFDFFKKNQTLIFLFKSGFI